MANSFQGGTFDPIRQADYVPALEQNIKLQERGMDRYYAQLRENNRIQANMAGDTLKALSQLSSKVGKIVEVKQKKKQEADFAQGMADYYEYGFPADESAAFNKAEDDEVDNQSELNKIAAKVEKEKGPWTAERFRKLSAHRQLGMVTAYVSEQAFLYNPVEIDGILDSTDPSDLGAKLSQYRHEKYKKLEGINPAIINKYFFTQQRKIDADLYDKFNSKRAAELKAQRLENYHLGFRDSVKTGEAGKGYTDYIKLSSGDHGGDRAARLQANKLVKREIEAGLLTADDITSIGNAEIDHRGSGKKKFKDIYKAEYQDMLDVLDAKIVADHRRKENLKTVEFANEEDTVIEELGDNFSEDTVEAQQDVFIRKYGKRSDKLDLYKKEFSHEAKVKEDFVKAATKLAEDNQLTSERLQKFPYYVRRQFRDVAQETDAIHTANKLPLKAIEDAVKFKGKTLPNGNSHPSVGLKVSQLQSKYLNLVQSLQISDVKNAEEVAMTKVLTDFEKNPEINKLGVYQIDQPKAVQETAVTASFKKIEIDSYIDSMGASALDSPEAFYSKEELVGLAKGYGTNGWTTTPRVNYIAERLGVDPLTAMNRMLAAVDLPDIEETESFKALNEKVQAEKRNLINKTNNSDRSVRAWGSTGEDNISIVPDGQGQELFDLAQETGGVFAEYAAALDILPRLNLNEITSMEEDEDLMLEYNKSIFKYSGGTNLEALNNTLRSDFRTNE